MRIKINFKIVLTIFLIVSVVWIIKSLFTLKATLCSFYSDYYPLNCLLFFTWLQLFCIIGLILAIVRIWSTFNGSGVGSNEDNKD